MIWMYTGTNGSGKSVHAARDIYSRLRRRKHNRVIATFDINTDSIKGMKGDVTYINIYKITPEWLIEYALEHHVLDGPVNEVEGQTIVIIDEAQRIFNSRDYNANDRRAWLDWFPEHRKWGFNFILITPHDKMIDKQIRALVEYEVRHRKANNFGFIGFVITLFGKQCFFCITYWYSVKVKCEVEVVFGRDRYYKLYNTFQRFNKEGDPAAARAGGAASPVGGPTTLAADEDRRKLMQRLVCVLAVAYDKTALAARAPEI